MFFGGAMKVVNLEEYIRVGGGRWGESFNHRENPDIMMKLYGIITTITTMAVKEL